MKEFKITEEQIKENKDLTLKEYFKEVFEIKLEVGKWYVVENIQKGSLGYDGIGMFTKEHAKNGLLRDDFGYNFLEINGSIWRTNGDIRLATEEEVFNALKKEAEKRGFVKGAKVKDNGLHISCMQNEILKENAFRFHLSDNKMWMDVGKDNYCCLIFDNGKWAEIISQPEEVIELNGVKYKRID